MIKNICPVKLCALLSLQNSAKYTVDGEGARRKFFFSRSGGDLQYNTVNLTVIRDDTVKGDGFQYVSVPHIPRDCF